MDNLLALECGIDIPVPSCQVIVHQPKIKEIALLGELRFFAGAQCLTVNKSMVSEDNSLLENTTNFQIFMTIMSQPETKDKKDDVLQLLSILLPDYKASFTPNSIILMGIGENKETLFIDDSNFDDFQEVLKEVFCFKIGPMDQTSFNPADKKAKEIAEKLMRGRERIAAEKGGSVSSVLTQYTSTLTIGLGSMSLEDIINLTLFQLYDLVERYMLYVNWDIDIRTRLAGGTPDSPPDNWMKNIH